MSTFIRFHSCVCLGDAACILHSRHSSVGHDYLIAERILFCLATSTNSRTRQLSSLWDLLKSSVNLRVVAAYSTVSSSQTRISTPLWHQWWKATTRPLWWCRAEKPRASVRQQRIRMLQLKTPLMNAKSIDWYNNKTILETVGGLNRENMLWQSIPDIHNQLVEETSQNPQSTAFFIQFVMTSLSI